MSGLTPEQEKLAHEKFRKALERFPERNAQVEKELKEALSKIDNPYYALYEALHGLGDGILNIPGRFMYNPISELKKGDYYHLGINPSVNPNKPKDKLLLCQRLREWSSCTEHAIEAEKWGNQTEHNAIHLCRGINAKLRELPASNLFFSSSKDTKSIPRIAKERVDLFLDVHKAVLEIVKPKCFFVTSTATEIYTKIVAFLGLRMSRSSTPRCLVSDGEYQGRPMMLIGIFPRGGYANLHQAADMAIKFVKDHP
jgi:hypothetical protein